MPGSTELRDYAEIFSLSTGLSQAALSLEKIANNGTLSPIEVRNLQWTAKLMGELDWNGPYYRKTGFSAVQATMLRPDYFRKLQELRFTPSSDYIMRLYETMYSGGKNITLSTTELETTKKVLKGMSDDLLQQITSGNI